MSNVIITKEKLSKLLVYPKRYPKLANYDKFKFINLNLNTDLYEYMCTINNIPAVNQSTKFDFTDIELPLIIATPSLSINFDSLENADTDEYSKVDVDISKTKNTIMVISDIGDNMLVEHYFKDINTNGKYALHCHYKLPKLYGEMEILPELSKLATDEMQLTALTAVSHIEVTTFLNIIKYFHMVKGPKLSDLKLRNIRASEREYHQPWKLIPILKSEIAEHDNQNILLDPVAVAKNMFPDNDSLLGEYNLFVAANTTNKVAYKPTIFKYLPFEKFAYIIPVIQGDSRHNVMALVDNSSIDIYAVRRKDKYKITSIKLSHIKASDNDWGLTVTNIQRMAPEYLYEKGILNDAIEYEMVCSTISNIVGMLITYNNVKPQYHHEPTPHNKLHFMREYNEVSNSTVVIQLNKPNHLRLQGHLGGTHASPVEHYRIGHNRRLKSGKIVKVKGSRVNANKGNGTNYHIYVA